MSGFTFKQANKRYRRLFLPVMILYVALCFAGPGIMAAFNFEPPAWVMAPVAILSGAPIAAVFWLLGRFVKETDEYTRAVQTQALLTGGGITFSLAVIWSFLELYQVVPRSKFFPSMMMVGPAFFFCYGISAYVQHKRSGGSMRDFSGPGREKA